MSQGKLIRDTAEAVEGLLKAVPVYQDAAQPAVREVGELLKRAVRAALAPLRGVVWGAERLEEYLHTELTERLKRVPPERIQTPNPVVAGPTLEALRFVGNEPTLRAMYTNLLGTAMDRESAERAHPAFADVIRQLTPDEAKLMTWISTKESLSRPVISIYMRARHTPTRREVFRHFSLLGLHAGCEYPHMTPTYLANLCRLGLMEMPEGRSYPPAEYQPLEEHPEVLELKKRIESGGSGPEIARHVFDVTSFGAQFLAACVLAPRKES